MKTHKDLIFVTVPERTKRFKMVPIGSHVELSYLRGASNEVMFQGCFYLREDYKIFGIASELTEKQWGEIVDKVPFYDCPTGESILGPTCYKDYNEVENWVYETATESGYSLLKSLGFNVDDRILVIKIKND